MENELNRAHKRSAATLTEEEKLLQEYDECRQALMDGGSAEEIEYWKEREPKLSQAIAAMEDKQNVD